MIRLRRPAGALPAEAFTGDPPVYRETLRELVGRNPSFMLERRIAPPVPEWSALDAVVEAAREGEVAA